LVRSTLVGNLSYLTANSNPNHINVLDTLLLPASSLARLLGSDPNAIPFKPLGKPKMREWVQINLDDSEAYARYEPVFIESTQFVHK
jgi:hypothetical protein